MVKNHSLTDLKQLFQYCYFELNALAHRKLQFEVKEFTLDTTGLVHEVYEKMHQQQNANYKNSNHFLAVASMVMRRVLINHARDKKRQKRGGDMIMMTYSKVNHAVKTTPEDILYLHDALNGLKKLNKRQYRVVEFYFFGGFTHKEIADYLNVSEETVRRDWRLARAWLSLQLKNAF
jgi:RNA polymerase sigma factor (TIGR02999 family)